MVNRCGGNATIIDGNAPFRAFRGLADDDDGTCLGGGVKSGVLKKGFAKVGRYPQATTYDTAWGVVIPAQVGSAPSNPLEGSGE